MKNWLTGKDPDAGKDWRWEEKGTIENETVGWHHWLAGHEFEQDLGVGDGQGSLVCCCPWGCKDSDMTGRLNWTEYLTGFLWWTHTGKSFSGGSDGKESACNAGDLGLIPGWGRSPGERNGSPLQCSCLENSMDRGAWQSTYHGVSKSKTGLSDKHFHFSLSHRHMWEGLLGKP